MPAAPAGRLAPPVTPLEIFHAYRAENRGRSFPGHKLELSPHLARHVAEIPGEDGFIGFADIQEDEAPRVIDEQVAYFAGIGQRFEWKIHDFDHPPTLKQLLEARGFRAADVEAFLVIETAKWIRPARAIPGLEVRRIDRREQLRDTTGDPWDARSLEWSTSSPPPEYNFAFTPVVYDNDAWWDMKQRGVRRPLAGFLPIHMPKNTAAGVVLAGLSTVLGFAMIWHIWWLAGLSAAALLVAAIVHTFNYERDYHIPAETVARTEEQRTALMKAHV